MSAIRSISSRLQECAIDHKIVMTRTFTVRGVEGLEQLLRAMKQDRFSGKIVVIMSEGGLNAVTAEESHKLNTRG